MMTAHSLQLVGYFLLPGVFWSSLPQGTYSALPGVWSGHGQHWDPSIPSELLGPSALVVVKLHVWMEDHQ